MDINVKIITDPQGAKLAKFDNRRIYLIKKDNGDNFVMFKTLYKENIEHLEKSIELHPNYFDTIVRTRFGVITTKVILMSSEAIEILNHLKNQ